MSTHRSETMGTRLLERVNKLSYRVNAASGSGAVSAPALTLDQARTKAEVFKSKGYTNVVIIDAGTGTPVEDA